MNFAVKFRHIFVCNIFGRWNFGFKQSGTEIARRDLSNGVKFLGGTRVLIFCTTGLTANFTD